MTFHLTRKTRKTRKLTGSAAVAAVGLSLLAPAALAHAQPAPGTEPGTTTQGTTAHATSAHGPMKQGTPVQRTSAQGPAVQTAAARAGAAAPLLIGHRGAAGTAPENTVAAFKHGRASGADFIETDVQLSADGIPFLFHDNTPARTTDVEDVFPGRENDPITSFTWAELQQLDAGSYFSGRFAGERIPHLDDVARLATGGTGVYLEIKSPGNSPGIERLVAGQLRTNPVWSRLVSAGKVQVLGFDEASNRRFAQLAPEVPLQQLSGTVPGPAVLAGWAEFADSVGTNYRTLDAAQVDDVKAAGLVMGVYTANSPEAVRQSIALGVDAVTGDFPIQTARALTGKDPFPAAPGLEISSAVNNPAANNILRVGDGYTLAPGDELRVYAGPGENTSGAYYNGLAGSVLNNGGDSVALWSAQGKLLDVFAN